MAAGLTLAVFGMCSHSVAHLMGTVPIAQYTTAKGLSRVLSSMAGVSDPDTLIMVPPADMQKLYQDEPWHIETFGREDASDFLESLVRRGLACAELLQVPMCELFDDGDPRASSCSDISCVVVGVMLAAQQDPCACSSVDTRPSAPAPAAAVAVAEPAQTAEDLREQRAIKKVGGTQGLASFLGARPDARELEATTHMISTQHVWVPSMCELMTVTSGQVACSTARQPHTSLGAKPNANERDAATHGVLLSAQAADAINKAKKVPMARYLRKFVPGTTPAGKDPYTYALATDKVNAYTAGTEATVGYIMNELIITSGGATPKDIPIQMIKNKVYGWVVPRTVATSLPAAHAACSAHSAERPSLAACTHSCVSGAQTTQWLRNLPACRAHPPARLKSSRGPSKCDQRRPLRYGAVLLCAVLITGPCARSTTQCGTRARQRHTARTSRRPGRTEVGAHALTARPHPAGEHDHSQTNHAALQRS